MFIVYAIQSLRDGRIYVGLSSNFDRRLKEHNGGAVFSTKGYCPWRLIYKEEGFSELASARNREKYLKSGIGKEFLKSKSNTQIDGPVAQW